MTDLMPPVDILTGIPHTDPVPRRKVILRGSGVAALRESLTQLSRAGAWPLLDPLPVTRFLGESFGVSNASAHRVLSALCEEEALWRSPTGRFFLPAARRLLEKPMPIACLLRRLERWTEVGRDIMQGIDAACGELDRAMLLTHDRVLFRQSDPTTPPASGTDPELRAAMADFFLVHGGRISGVVLDELWPDRVLARFEPQLKSSVLVYRRTTLPFVGSVGADVDSAAAIVLNIARAGRFQRLAVIAPEPGYPPADEMLEAILQAASGCFPPPPVFHMNARHEIPRLLRALQRRRRERVLLLGTEDNTTVAAMTILRESGVRIPEQVGVISTMGSRIALAEGITSAGYDFQAMGAAAAAMAISGKIGRVRMPASHFPGSTT